MPRTFEIVSDSRRREAQTGSNPVYNQVKAGKTVFIPNKSVEDFDRSRTYMKRLGWNLFIRQEADGVMVWAEKEDKE